VIIGAAKAAVDLRAYVKFCPHLPHFVSDLDTARYMRCPVEIIECLWGFEINLCQYFSHFSSDLVEYLRIVHENVLISLEVCTNRLREGRTLKYI
jgi:hypothetical protein